MRSTRFGSIFHIEVLLNSKRISPYVMALLFVVNAVLWWGWGAAVHYGWATNGDFFIGRNFSGFSLGTLPLFTAIFMGGAVTRDYRYRVDPLIFSKPVGRTSYLLGKFFGNFFVLVCCQMVFMLTLVLLQGISKSNMVVQPLRVLPYLKAFIIIVVIPHLVLAAFYFTIGALTRDSKFVYGLAIFFYPLYVAAQILLFKNVPNWWQIILDPFYSMASGITRSDWTDAQLINQYVYTLGAGKIANSVIMLLLSALCLTIVCLLFKREEHADDREAEDQMNQFQLSGDRESVYLGEVGSPSMPEIEVKRYSAEAKIALPRVETHREGFRAHLSQLAAALNVEFRLLRAERGLILLAPLTIFASTMGLSFYGVSTNTPYSITYASNTADSVVIFLLGLTIFYLGETMHRDHETRVEPILWSCPVPTIVLLLAKYLAMATLSFVLLALLGLTAVTLQILRGHTPVELTPYLLVYTVIVAPSVLLATGLSIALNIWFRDKYLTYAVSLALGGGLFYLYSQGYNHWLYNPLLYQRWTYAELIGGLKQIMVHRIYCLALLCLSLSVALLFHPRRSADGLLVERRLSGAGWSALIAILAATIAALTGMMLISPMR